MATNRKRNTVFGAAAADHAPCWRHHRYCTPGEFIAGWRYTVEYLRNTRHVHNMLLVFAPDQPSFSINSTLGYAERWPVTYTTRACARVRTR